MSLDPNTYFLDMEIALLVITLAFMAVFITGIFSSTTDLLLSVTRPTETRPITPEIENNSATPKKPASSLFAIVSFIILFLF